MSDNEREYQEALALHLEIADVSMKVTVKALFMSFSDEGMAALIKMLQEYGRPTVPGHGLYKPREHDPVLAELEVHGTITGRFTSNKPAFEEVSSLPEGDEKYIEHEYGS